MTPVSANRYQGIFNAPANPSGIVQTYEVTVRATDLSGNSGSEDCDPFTVAPDTEGPVITNCEVDPTELPNRGGHVDISANVVDPGGVQSVVALVKRPDATVAVVSMSGEGAYSGTFVVPRNPSPVKQVYEVVVRATDTAGNIASEICDFIHVAPAAEGGPPVISRCRVAPAELGAGGGEITVTATVRAVSPATLTSMTARATRTGESPRQIVLQRVGHTNDFRGTARLPANPERSARRYQVTLTARDSEGRQRTASCGEVSVAGQPREQRIGSARVRLLQGNRLVTQALLRRVGNGFDGRFAGLRPGVYRAEADGYASTNGTGPVIARGTGSTTVAAGQASRLRLAWVFLEPR